jgi:hypothetical protein
MLLFYPSDGKDEKDIKGKMKNNGNILFFGDKK